MPSGRDWDGIVLLIMLNCVSLYFAWFRSGFGRYKFLNSIVGWWLVKVQDRDGWVDEKISDVLRFHSKIFV